MKRNILAVCALAMTMLVLAGCASSKSGSAQEEAPSTSAVVTEAPTETTAVPTTVPTTEAAPTAAPKTVSPLPSGIDMAHLDNCSVAVSFDEGDAYVDDTGKMQLKVKVYAYDVYDAVDISTLQVGDQLTICRQDVKVTSLEQDEYGAVIINGGPENGGYRLVSGEESGFHAMGLNDTKAYYELGEATIPVSVDFIFEDSSDLEKGTCTYYPGDFLTDAGIVYHFVPDNTTITIQDGYVIGMQRVYIP